MNENWATHVNLHIKGASLEVFVFELHSIHSLPGHQQMNGSVSKPWKFQVGKSGVFYALTFTILISRSVS